MTDISYGTPEEAGFDPDRIAALKDRAPDWIDGFRMRSAVLMAVRGGKIAFHEAYGPLTDQPGSPALEPDSVFSVNSVTKPITATAIMILVEDGLLGLNRPITEYLPEICGEGAQDIEVQHLLTHTSGYDEMESLALQATAMPAHKNLQGDPETGLHRFVARHLASHWDLKSNWAPGSKMSYCNHNYALLAEIIRRVSGETVETFMATRIFEPLGMKDTTLCRDEAKMPRTVRRGADVAFGSVTGNPGAGNEGIWLETAPWGYMGVFSTVLDLAKFGQMFLGGGSYGGKRILSPASVREMTRNQIPGIPGSMGNREFDDASWGLGFMVTGDRVWSWSPSLLTRGTFGHGGAGGIILMIDPHSEVLYIALTVCLDVDLEAQEMRMNVDRYMNMVAAAVVD